VIVAEIVTVSLIVNKCICEYEVRYNDLQDWCTCGITSSRVDVICSV
jgi:hypothetical protein